MRVPGCGTARGRQPHTRPHPAAAVPELHQALVFSGRTVGRIRGDGELCSKRLQIWHIIAAHRLSAEPAHNTFVLQQRDQGTDKGKPFTQAHMKPPLLQVCLPCYPIPF